MNQQPQSTCPKCGASIPEEAPQNLCPVCVLAGVAHTPASPAARGRTSAPTVAEVAAQFPELEILELIGVGGMGAVYKARQPKLGRLVALKILSHDLSSDPEFVERFNREAILLARLNHPNIVTIFDFGSKGPFCFLLMELVEGVNLRQAMRAGGFTPADSLALVQDVCSALKFAHEEGILHRDIKPENILIDTRGRVKIADFGIAKIIAPGGGTDYTLTMPGAVLGSPHYMAPEQIETPGNIDQRADIYSLGVVFYELLTRELPLGRFAPPSERSPMDPRIDEIVMRALEKDRNARYQNVGEVKTGVAAITASRPVAQPPAGTPPPAQVPPSPVPIPPAGPQKPPAPAIRWKAALIFLIITTIIEIIVEVIILSGEKGAEDAAKVIALVCLPALILSVIYSSILHYQCWKAIPENLRTITPASAVGFIFIPFFNFYWAFITWPKLADGLTEWQRSIGWTSVTSAKGLGVTYGILFVLTWTLGVIPGFGSVLSILTLIIFIIFYRSVVKTINRINGHA